MRLSDLQNLDLVLVRTDVTTETVAASVSLRDNVEQLKLSRELTTIRRDVELDVDIDELDRIGRSADEQIQAVVRQFMGH